MGQGITASLLPSLLTIFISVAIDIRVPEVASSFTETKHLDP